MSAEPLVGRIKADLLNNSGVYGSNSSGHSFWVEGDV